MLLQSTSNSHLLLGLFQTPRALSTWGTHFPIQRKHVTAGSCSGTTVRDWTLVYGLNPFSVLIALLL